MTSPLRMPSLLACVALAAASLTAQSIPIPLNYNFNGIVHLGEGGAPDAPAGFRSISDRALDFRNGIPNDPLLAGYQLVAAPGVLDLVHLGNRNQVDAGNWAFEPSPNGNNIGTQPTWLANADQSGPQTTVLSSPVVVVPNASIGFLYQVSNGGGAFDVEFGFANGAPVLATVSGGDWFGGSLPGVSETDNAAVTGANLNLTERTIDLSAEAGRLLTSVTFRNATNLNAGYAIVAMNVVGCIDCANGALAQISNLGGGTGATISTSSNGGLGCDLEWSVSGGVPNAPGAWLIGAGITAIPVAAVTPGCPGTLFVDSPILFNDALDANGESTFTLAFPAVVNQALCGFTVVAQHGTIGLPPCLFSVSDALAITIGN